MGERDARERFARAVDEGATHSDDQEFGDELDVVTTLRRAGAFHPTEQQTRRNVAARIAHKVAAQQEQPEPAPQRTRRGYRGYLRPTLVAALCLLASLGGLALLMSEDALPGDTLYSVKRAREATVLALTSDDQERAMQRLTYAEGRIDELGKLATGSVTAGQEATDYATGLADFEAATRAASSTLTRLGTSSGGAQLETLRSWTRQRSGELRHLAHALPPATAGRQADTAQLLRQVRERVGALTARFDCYQITTGSSDEIGMLPATGRCLPPNSDPAAPDTAQPAPRTPPPGTRQQPPQDNGTTEQEGDSRRTGREAVAQLASLPETTDSGRHEPLRFQPVPPASTPESPDRPRLPGDAGHRPPGELNQVVDGILPVPLD